MENLTPRWGIRPACRIASDGKVLGFELMRVRGLFDQAHASGKEA
jgi:hypothetical protein